MQAIQTKYHGPTDASGSRITARCAAKRITVSYDHALDLYENHRAAAVELCKRLQWSGDMSTGTLADGSMVHVFNNGERKTR